MMKFFLLVAAAILVPVALSYGVDPAVILPKFMNIAVEGTDQTHIFRALMCLYLGMSTFCVIATFTARSAARTLSARYFACSERERVLFSPP